MALGGLDELLVDHAHCEKKAAAQALSLVNAYPERERLVRRLCGKCRKQADPSRAELAFLGVERSDLRGTRFQAPGGCAKCGGVGPALRMIRKARELGMKVMLGCMLESSIGVAAGAMVASEVAVGYFASWISKSISSS